MKRFGLVILAVFTLAAFAQADDARYVYEIRELATAKVDPWSMNMGIIAEAARLYAPVSFVKSGHGVSISMDATVSFSLGGSVEVERSDERALVRHEVTLQGTPAKPKADKRVTIRFSLSEIVKNGGTYAGSPLMYALRKAISGASYTSGRAWVVSAKYDGAGRFVVVVGLARK